MHRDGILSHRPWLTRTYSTCGLTASDRPPPRSRKRSGLWLKTCGSLMILIKSHLWQDIWTSSSSCCKVTAAHSCLCIIHFNINSSIRYERGKKNVCSDYLSVTCPPQPVCVCVCVCVFVYVSVLSSPLLSLSLSLCLSLSVSLSLSLPPSTSACLSACLHHVAASWQRQPLVSALPPSLTHTHTLYSVAPCRTT